MGDIPCRMSDMCAKRRCVLAIAIKHTRTVTLPSNVAD